MLTKTFIMISIIMSASAFGFTDLKDTAARLSECDSLRYELNSVNAKLDKMMVEFSSKGQLSLKYDTKRWGKGWSIGAGLSSGAIWGVEVGYTHKTVKGSFLGVSLGYENSILQEQSSQGPDALSYIKLSAATPIFLNCMSIKASLFPTYYYNYYTDFGEGIISRVALGVGPSIVFWLNPLSSFYIEQRYTFGYKEFMSNWKIGYTFTFTRK